MIQWTSFLVGFAAALALGCSSQSLTPEDSQAGGGKGGNEDPSGALSRAAYPEGPFGRGVGAIIANLKFLGWRDPAKAGYDPNKLEEVSLADFYNPDGVAGRPRLIMLNASAVWCSVCKVEYRHMINTDVYGTRKPKGIEIIGVLFEDARNNPAKPSDLVIWGGPDGFNVPFPLVLDPGFKSGAYFESDATPMNMLIDASNMRILDITMGYNSAKPEEYWNRIDAWLAQ
jgi:hypothetical protein